MNTKTEHHLISPVDIILYYIDNTIHNTILYYIGIETETGIETDMIVKVERVKKINNRR